MAEVKVKGLEDILKRLERVPAEVKAKVKPSVDKGADELVNTMRNLAPEEDGVLKGSIRKEAGDTELSVKVAAGGDATTKPVRDGASATYDYALAIEFGRKSANTPDKGARPFFWPAYRTLRKRIRGRINRTISKVVREAYYNK